VKPELPAAEWDFRFLNGGTEAATALCYEWEFTRQINRENGTSLRGTNAWGDRFRHAEDISFVSAVPREHWEKIWEELQSAWLEVGAITAHEPQVFPWFLNKHPERGMRRETSQTSHRKNARGQIVQTNHSFPIRWEVPDKFIIEDVRRWLKHHRKAGFPAGKVAKAERQKPWAQTRLTSLFDLGIYRAWKHHGGRPREFRDYIFPKYECDANYSHAVQSARKHLRQLHSFVSALIDDEENGPRFLF
jgi:hypothetical protein